MTACREAWAWIAGGLATAGIIMACWGWERAVYWRARYHLMAAARDTLLKRGR